jgi:hypothetical protein
MGPLLPMHLFVNFSSKAALLPDRCSEEALLMCEETIWVAESSVATFTVLYRTSPTLLTFKIVPLFLGKCCSIIFWRSCFSVLQPTKLNVHKNDAESWDYTAPNLGKWADKTFLYLVLQMSIVFVYV